MNNYNAKQNQIKLDTWPRQPHFSLFKNFTQPYFNVCVRLPISSLYDYCKEHGYSFFHAYIYVTLQACNGYAPIRQRIINDKPYQLNEIRASVVELANDDTFRFSYFNQCNDFESFTKHAKYVSQQTKQQPLISDAFKETEGKPDLIHISVLPWLNFTSFTHATTEGDNNAIPKLVFGQYDQSTGDIPLSIDVHHALMDGLHVAQFIANIQRSITLFN